MASYSPPLTEKAAEQALLRLLRLRARELGITVQELSARLREALAEMRSRDT